MRNSEATAALAAQFGERLLIDEPLARHTSARIGGPADAFLAAQTIDDLREAARIAWSHELPLTLLGGGSNVLISDEGIRGLVLRNQSDWHEIDGNQVRVASGVNSIRLARTLANQGLAGFEWAIGVPGSIGGALYGNAGAHGSDMAANVLSAEVAIPHEDEGLKTKVWSNEELAFDYRSSVIKRERRRCVILAVTFGFEPDAPEEIHARMEEYNAYRKRTQPPGATLGSMFKNPPGDYAGRLIDAAGLKGFRIGGAQISEKHANFFLNSEEASAGEIKALIDYAASRVYDQFGVHLKLEIELLGDWG
ncbi:MAG: UDP-N-acetylmuramate dehydrogenase [Chloroflexi bacterium]|nr:UDP-N-acetylmuramate dehydrogenase [Chloroflexota bacterium]